MQILLKSKIVVFDINKTLVHLSRQLIPNINSHFHVNAFYAYIRPNFYYLTYHQQYLSSKITFLLWTSKKKHNAQKIAKILENQGLKFDKLYCQDHCKEDLSKDLNVIANELKADIHNIYLVDDTHKKGLEGQNFIYIQEYNGINTQDKQLVRVVKQLYNLAQIKMENQIDSKAMEKEIESRLRLMTISQNNNNTKKGKKKYVEKPQPKKQKQKKQLEQHKLPQNVKIRNQLKQGTQIKCIVFDINETLLYRSQHKIEGIDSCQQNKSYYYYARPYLSKLKQFIQQYNVKICLWSSLKLVNLTQFIKLLNIQGLKIDQVFSAENLIQGKKNLLHVANFLQISIQNIVLVDDSLKKRVQGQNYIQISVFDGTNRQDDSLLHLIQELKKKCQEKKQQ